MKSVPFVPPIAVLGLLQMLICTYGFIVFAANIKVTHFADESPIPKSVANSRDGWLLLFLFPVFWTLAASYDVEYEITGKSSRFHVICGVVLLIGLGYLWMVLTGSASRASFISG